MAQTTFDPLNIVPRLTRSGMPVNQAEVFAELVLEQIQPDPDLPITRQFLQSQLDHLRDTLVAEIGSLVSVGAHKS